MKSKERPCYGAYMIEDPFQDAEAGRSCGFIPTVPERELMLDGISIGDVVRFFNPTALLSGENTL